jgi:hypothetical protein
MPSVQQGQVVKTRGGTWSYRFYNADGKRVQKGGYPTKSEARSALGRELDGIKDPQAARRNQTVAELVAEYLESHVCADNTLRTLTYNLTYLTRQFGDVRLDRLRTQELVAWRKTLPVGSRRNVFQSARQVLSSAGVTVASDIKNPEPKREPKTIFPRLGGNRSCCGGAGFPFAGHRLRRRHAPVGVDRVGTPRRRPRQPGTTGAAHLHRRPGETHRQNPRVGAA